MNVDRILMGLFILYFIKSVLLGIHMEMPEVKTTRKWINVRRKKGLGRKLSSPLSTNNKLTKILL